MCQMLVLSISIALCAKLWLMAFADYLGHTNTPTIFDFLATAIATFMEGAKFFCLCPNVNQRRMASCIEEDRKVSLSLLFRTVTFILR
mmetsp:Transcript_15213/g.31093  ORF Transcript_15213/g.31093 Transcript_15213/m.31093 type:complete len:88 (+) Transcript_15213:183-446(+)